MVNEYGLSFMQNPVNFISPCEAARSARWSFVYAHGAAQDLVETHGGWPPDIISSKSNMRVEDVDEGIYTCTVYDEPATVWLWNARLERHFKKGLVCLDSDKKSCRYAQKCFDQKHSII